MIPDIFLVALQKYISFLPVYIPYVRTTLTYFQCLLRSQRYLGIFTGSGPKMRLSKQFSIVYYRHQKLLINRNCPKRLMFLQGAIGHHCTISSLKQNCVLFIHCVQLRSNVLDKNCRQSCTYFADTK